MARRTHTERWWEAAPPHTIRCGSHNKSDGARCRAEAAHGTTVCDRHGALAPAVQAAAANRVQMSVDGAARFLIDAMNDAGTDMRERVKIAHDLLNRGGLAPTSRHLVGVVGQGDAVETLFLDLLRSPGALSDPLASTPAPADDAQFAELNRAADRDPDDEEDLIGDVVDAELVEDSARNHTVRGSASMSDRPPKRIRDDLERLGLL